ncbi:MAG: hypothetical protein QM654_03185 [Dysgonamonadaceae bacterium]
MKLTTNLFIAVFAIVTMSVTFVSCGGSDDDDWTETSQMLKATSSSTIQAANGTLTFNDTINLSDLIGTEIANNLISSDFQNTGWNIKLNGLKAFAGSSVITLSSVKVRINNGTQFDLGAWTSEASSSANESDTELSGNSFLSFMNEYHRALTTGNRRAILTYTIVSSSTIEQARKIAFKYTTNVKYVYRKYN